MARKVHPVRFLAKQTPGPARTVSLKIANWKTIINKGTNGDKVEFENQGNGPNHFDLTIEITDPGPFTVNTNVLLPKGSTKTRYVDPNASGDYKFKVKADLPDGDNFTYDPRFIIT